MSDEKTLTAVVERDADGLYVGFIPDFPGAHTQAETLGELNVNLREVAEMLLEDGEPKAEPEFAGTQLIEVTLSLSRSPQRHSAAEPQASGDGR